MAFPREVVDEVRARTDIAALIAYQLTREGLRVETASSGTEALTAVGREVPDEFRSRTVGARDVAE